MHENTNAKFKVVKLFGPSLLYDGYRVFLGGRSGRGVGLTPHLHLVPKVVEKSRAIPVLTLRAYMAYKKGENLFWT